MLGITAVAVIVPFHCVEAMFGTSPRGVETSLGTFIEYYVCPVPLRRDEITGKPIVATRSEILFRIRDLIQKVILLSMIFSVTTPFEFNMFVSLPKDENDNNNASIIILHDVWNHLLNNYMNAASLSMGMDFTASGIALVSVLVTGKSTIHVMNSPMTMSTSPSDFWGHRWNMVQHGSLK
eukprot:CAMPEP_0118708116 /NCGR_PEP_ID=MMETSP0800-20121206/21668_1 /TAXON_ID=210618 ORGANISM="Striatella unipunctata, Strain CCMP2910" /NCGR_SAMPLE_ID=MMETSP0800 /ASSEMBLY_ACC=CAM_ASM_000638 /LENGTH=179 /DNA_ID=CAMNT_0006611193 /DNA_START=161 /DNA_END=697 /DNA_ORIENTATION=-